MGALRGEASFAAALLIESARQANKIIVRRALKGKVLEFEGDAKVQAQEEGLRTVNPSNEVVWTVSLAAGEEKTVRYRYQSLILQTRERYTCSW